MVSTHHTQTQVSTEIDWDRISLQKAYKLINKLDNQDMAILSKKKYPPVRTSAILAGKTAYLYLCKIWASRYSTEPDFISGWRTVNNNIVPIIVSSNVPDEHLEPVVHAAQQYQRIAGQK